MRLHRFYIGDIAPLGHTITISDADLLNQWRSVFRMKAKEQVLLFNSNGIEYTCALLAIDRKSARLEVLSEEAGRRASHEVILCAALIKKDNFDLIVQKAVELGATTIIPLLCERSEKKGLNHTRIVKIAIEATEQCGRVDVPTIGMPISFENALNALGDDTAIIGFEPTGSPFDAKVFAHKKLALFIGPEGGWTQNELTELQNRGRVMRLPTYILRAETAAIATLTLAAALA